jgi:hypothetical protein
MGGRAMRTIIGNGEDSARQIRRAAAAIGSNRDQGREMRIFDCTFTPGYT